MLLNKKLLILACIIALLAFGTACKKNENTDGTGIVPVQTVTCMVDADAFSANSVIHSVENDSIDVFLCTATNGDKLTIKIANLLVGQHLINPDDTYITFLTGGVLYDQNPAPSGHITITEKTAYRISGSFETVVNNISETGFSKQITNGAFSQIEY
jgi:hypothetical protein